MAYAKASSIGEVRRLLQFGTFVLLLAVVLAPVFEYFDRGDAPGLGNDTEIAVFVLVLLLCLVLAVCKILSNISHRFESVLVAMIWPERSDPLYLDQAFPYKLILPPIFAPLQI